LRHRAEISAAADPPHARPAQADRLFDVLMWLIDRPSPLAF
jgi:hypothetical protein